MNDPGGLLILHWHWLGKVMQCEVQSKSHGCESTREPIQDRMYTLNIRENLLPKEPMRPQFYFTTRNLHLYAGLFLSPFVLAFAISVIFLNHPGISLGKPDEYETKTMRVEVPAGIEKPEGMERIQRAREILRQANLSGEISFIGYSARDGSLTIPVSKPGYEAIVTVALPAGWATIAERRTGFWDSLIFLHKMPGPHLANIRGNWWAVRVWAVLADGTAWLLIFLSVTGVYLWAAIRSERRIGLTLLLGGGVSLLGALYAIFG